MLDSFEIITTSGVVLWSRQYASVSPAIVDKFIKDVFIEENTALTAGGHGKDNDTTNAFTSGSTTTTSAGAPAPYMTEQYAVKWAFVKELGIIFVAVYKSLLHLSWIDKLVENIKTIFVKLYGDQLTRPNTTIVECARFDDYFDQQMNELEGGGGGGGDREKRTMGNPALASPFSSAAAASLSDSSPASTPPIGTPTTSRPSTPGGGPQVAASSTSAQPSPPLSKISRRARKAQKTTGYSSDEAVVRKHQQNKDKATAGASGGKAAKRGRKWDANGLADEEADDDVLLDYSALDAANNKDKNGRSGLAVTAPAALEPVDASTWGSTTAKGQFVLKDLDDEVHSILAAAAAEESTKSTSSKAAAAAATAGGVEGLLGSGLSTISGLFRNVVGGKTLTKADLDKAMKGMEEHLLRKNVAREAAVRLCESVEAELLGVKTGNFESINTRVRSALESALTKMLTPTSSLDLLREIDAVTKASSPRPYVLSIVGVNGVGKSTNLSKICFFLLQNRYRVLVAAGDTFRSGAVEQLAVHVRNLQELTAREGGRVELYQRGYGKDAATVAKDAVTFAAQQGFDVVLIDTAGRRHNDQRLMSSLEKFAKLARPDKILMVAEALVGTDSVAQARNFNAAFGATRGLDGFIISKCDTVGNMVGTLVSLVHATHVPILFVGVGQHYSDLRNFSVRWAVERLLSNE